MVFGHAARQSSWETEASSNLVVGDMDIMCELNRETAA